MIISNYGDGCYDEGNAAGDLLRFFCDPEFVEYIQKGFVDHKRDSYVQTHST